MNFQHRSLVNLEWALGRISNFYPGSHVNPQAPVAQKIADEVVFRHFQGEGVEFFLKSDLTDPLRFLMRIFWKIPI